MDKEKIKEFIDKWNVGYEDKEQQIEFALEMEQDLLDLHQSSDAVIKKKEFNEIITLASDSSELTRIKLTNSAGHNFYFGVNSIGEIMKLNKSNDMWIKLIEDKNQNK